MRAPPGVKDDESGADFSRAQGKGVLYSRCSAKQSADTMQEFPA